MSRSALSRGPRKLLQAFPSETWDPYRFHIVDAGAADAMPAHWLELRPWLSILSFEPLAEEPTSLPAGVELMWQDIALDEVPGIGRLRVTREPLQSSLLDPDRQLLSRFPELERFDVVETLEVETDTLDHQLALLDVAYVDHIKLDTQGTELRILRGGKGALDNGVFALEVEVELIPMYKTQALLDDIAPFLRSRGFELFDLRPDYWKRAVGTELGGPRGQMIWADSLWFRRADVFAEILAHQNQPFRNRVRALKAMALCLLFGYSDFALEVAGVAQDAGILPSEDASRAIAAVQALGSVSRRVPGFPGRSRLPSLLRRLADHLDLPFRGWGFSSERLGNR